LYFDRFLRAFWLNAPFHGAYALSRPAAQRSPCGETAQTGVIRRRLAPRLERPSGNVGRLLDDDFCADLDAVVEVDHVGVVEAKASRRNSVSDRVRLVCA